MYKAGIYIPQQMAIRFSVAIGKAHVVSINALKGVSSITLTRQMADYQQSKFSVGAYSHVGVQLLVHVWSDFPASKVAWAASFIFDGICKPAFPYSPPIYKRSFYNYISEAPTNIYAKPTRNTTPLKKDSFQASIQHMISN